MDDQTQLNGHVSEWRHFTESTGMISQILVYYSPSLFNSLQKDRTTMEEWLRTMLVAYLLKGIFRVLLFTRLWFKILLTIDRIVRY